MSDGSHPSALPTLYQVVPCGVELMGTSARPGTQSACVACSSRGEEPVTVKGPTRQPGLQSGVARLSADSAGPCRASRIGIRLQ